MKALFIVLLIAVLAAIIVFHVYRYRSKKIARARWAILVTRVELFVCQVGLIFPSSGSQDNYWGNGVAVWDSSDFSQQAMTKEANDLGEGINWCRTRLAALHRYLKMLKKK